MLGVSLSGLMIASWSCLGNLRELIVSGWLHPIWCVGLSVVLLVCLAGCVSLGWQLSHVFGHTALYPGEDSSSFTGCLSSPSRIHLPGIGFSKRDQASINFTSSA